MVQRVSGTRSFSLALQVGLTYIGTVVGAGFASGQEIYQFFGRFGVAGFLGVVLGVLLFAWVGYRVMGLGQKLGATSYRELNTYLFGPRVGRWVDWLMTIMLFGVTVTMVAGAGALMEERLNWPYLLGTLLTIGITYGTLLRGMNGILRANMVIVPTMISFALAAAAQSLLHPGGGLQMLNFRTALPGPTWITALLSAVLYVAFNTGLAIGVLLPLGASMPSIQVIRRGACLGALGLGGMATAVMVALDSHPDSRVYAIPMAHIATFLGPWMRWVFVFVLWGEIYSTLVANVFALAAWLNPDNEKVKYWTYVFVLLVSLVVSLVGFTTMVRVAYPFFGWLCTFLVMTIVWHPWLEKSH